MSYATKVRAMEAGVPLLNQLGPGWSSKVWENMGWHVEAYRTLGGVPVQVWCSQEKASDGQAIYCALASELCLSYTGATPKDAYLGLRDEVLEAANEAQRQATKLLRMWEVM